MADLAHVIEITRTPRTPATTQTLDHEVIEQLEEMCVALGCPSLDHLVWELLDHRGPMAPLRRDEVVDEVNLELSPRTCRRIRALAAITGETSSDLLAQRARALAHYLADVEGLWD